MPVIEKYVSCEFLKDTCRRGRNTVVFLVGGEDVFVDLSWEDARLLIDGGTRMVRQGDAVIVLRAVASEVAEWKASKGKVI